MSDPRTAVDREQRNAPTLIALDDGLESIAAAQSEEKALDRQRALEPWCG